MGDLAESVCVHDCEGVDEAAPSDTIVMSDNCVMITETVVYVVEESVTFHIAGGGPCDSVGTCITAVVGVDKALSNLVVACDLLPTS